MTDSPEDLLQERRIRLAAYNDGLGFLPKRPLQDNGDSPISDDMDQRLVDAKLAAVEARTDTKFEKLLARLDSMDGKLTRIEAESIRTRSTVRTTGFTVVSIIVAVLGLIFAVFSQSFNLGARVSEVAHTEAVSVLANGQSSAPIALPAPQSASSQKATAKDR